MAASIPKWLWLNVTMTHANAIMTPEDMMMGGSSYVTNEASSHEPRNILRSGKTYIHILRSGKTCIREQQLIKIWCKAHILFNIWFTTTFDHPSYCRTGINHIGRRFDVRNSEKNFFRCDYEHISTRRCFFLRFWFVTKPVWEWGTAGGCR